MILSFRVFLSRCAWNSEICSTCCSSREVSSPCPASWMRGAAALGMTKLQQHTNTSKLVITSMIIVTITNKTIIKKDGPISFSFSNNLFKIFFYHIYYLSFSN